ncbi:MAG: endonuclease domain-containing protein [Sphingomonadaceae bacterium]
MVHKRLTPIARQLRREPTDTEIRLWSRLRGKQLAGHKFTRQFPIGNFVVDFAERTARIAIERDGGQHADSTADAERTAIIEAHGYQVIRYWNHDVLTNTEGVLEDILLNLRNARP